MDILSKSTTVSDSQSNNSWFGVMPSLSSHDKDLAAPVRLELTTPWLTVRCSTFELRGNIKLLLPPMKSNKSEEFIIHGYLAVAALDLVCAIIFLMLKKTSGDGRGIRTPGPPLEGLMFSRHARSTSLRHPATKANI